MAAPKKQLSLDTNFVFDLAEAKDCKPGVNGKGAEYDYSEALDVKNGSTFTSIDPAQLAVDPKTCKPIYPHSLLRVNTIFEVVKAAGLRTAWADKHPAYDLVNGPSGLGVDDLGFVTQLIDEGALHGGEQRFQAQHSLHGGFVEEGQSPHRCAKFGNGRRRQRNLEYAVWRAMGKLLRADGLC